MDVLKTVGKVLLAVVVIAFWLGVAYIVVSASQVIPLIRSSWHGDMLGWVLISAGAAFILGFWAGYRLRGREARP